MTTEAPSSDLVRSQNWSGSIPVVLTLAPNSLGTTMMPHPIHLLVPRGTFLHVGLRSAIQRLHKFAPATISLLSSGGMLKRNEPEPQGDDDEDDNEKTNGVTNAGAKNSKSQQLQSKDSFPVCWLEDEETQLPLRWHLFAGVLFDMMETSKRQSIPWKIRLHFFNYPSSQLLPMEADEVWTTIERSFKNSLKQALFLQYGSSRIAMNMTRQTHQRLWDSIESANYKLYQQINVDLQATNDGNNTSVQLLPIRVFLDSKPPIQRPCPAAATEGETATLTTLGDLLLGWLPEVFQKTADGDVEPNSPSCRWFVAGMHPPLSTLVLELWENLCHPDHFLYIVVLTR
ncbi:Autophagy protein 5 [Seminavis robusta]|uniref:Autophagy protein 5 n=1 Tax=Seminavis robusta TaxID=568900 RepID=A0A9N8DAS2_9STRA|nr:Autophagy protein 5 [Seminavis robusta]|eukprot:Sro37_g023430.1 Autophagy protein 5 (343) ;mRNA; r:132787-133891